MNDDDRSVRGALTLEAVEACRWYLRRLIDLTERSLAVHGSGFEVFSRLELMEQREKVDAARKRHSEIAARDRVDADSVVKEADARFQAEAETDVLNTMLIANHDAARPGDAYWSRQRVEAFAAEYKPEGKRWREHQDRRKNRVYDSQTVRREK